MRSTPPIRTTGPSVNTRPMRSVAAPISVKTRDDRALVPFPAPQAREEPGQDQHDRDVAEILARVAGLRRPRAVERVGQAGSDEREEVRATRNRALHFAEAAEVRPEERRRGQAGQREPDGQRAPLVARREPAPDGVGQPQPDGKDERGVDEVVRAGQALESQQQRERRSRRAPGAAAGSARGRGGTAATTAGARPARARPR